ncbi:MAG: class I SAM-dependent methyltransferase [Treponema sp.]|nr:class I SAM-dependent methyltransferase [Treponema sp.]
MNDTEKNAYQASLFKNRLEKQYRLRKKWARKNMLTCYRLYDRDIPEVPLSMDLYTLLPKNITSKEASIHYFSEANSRISENGPAAARIKKELLERTFLHMYLYERPYHKEPEAEAEWLSAMAEKAAETIGVEQSHVICKTRRRFSGGERGRKGQYERAESAEPVAGRVLENGEVFFVNLSDYIDTGLFFDHRPLRNIVRATCGARSVLNLFCYTGSFSVYAAEGNASHVHSIDASNTYLAWAQKNMWLNGFTDPTRFSFEKEDVLAWLERPNGTEKYDIIILDPPTFSNSKRSRDTLDLNRDWPRLVERCLRILSPHGTLYFSTNSRRLRFEEQALPASAQGAPLWRGTDITRQTIPEDYRNTSVHRVWRIERST